MSSFLKRGIVSAVAAISFSTTAGAQAAGHAHDGMAGMDHGTTAITPRAQKEIDAVEKAMLPLGTVAAATSAGFHPVFGWIPTMGVHWVNAPMMTPARQSQASSPSNLMFSRIGGRDSLVGAAYAYYAPVADTARPIMFDGAPSWHEHTNLAPPGMTLVMLHVWFVPSPDGPFAGTNPNLPFWAVGLGALDSTRMKDVAYASRVRRASLALAEVADTTAIFPNLENRPDVHAVLSPRRDSVRAIIPELKAAQEARDAARFDRAADRAAAQWDAMHAAYLESARSPQGRKRIEDFIATLMSDHGDHRH